MLHPARKNHDHSEQAIFISNELDGEVRDDSFTLITVSRIVPNKAIDLVLKALQIINRNEIPFRYIVVGEGPERESLQQLSANLGLQNKITFTGYISDEDKWRLLQASDLYVMPSRVRPEDQHEGFGIAFLEAAACGIPSVGTNRGARTNPYFPLPESRRSQANWNGCKRTRTRAVFSQHRRGTVSPRGVTAHLGCLFAMLLPVSKLSSCAKS